MIIGQAILINKWFEVKNDNKFLGFTRYMFMI